MPRTLYYVYVLLSTDINECVDTSTINCSQRCINTPGSYECDCYDGYQAITANATQCEGINDYTHVYIHVCNVYNCRYQ